MLQLAQCQGSGCSKLVGILAKITSMRTDAQKLLNITEDSSQAVSSESSHLAALTQAAVGGGKGKRRVASTATGLAAYNPPKKDNECRICKVLESEGDTDDLYEEHHHNYPTGCPRYIKMSIVERYQAACKAKLCLKCHDPSYTYKRYDKNHKCPADSKKTKFSCKSCSFHMWVCQRHQSDQSASSCQVQG